MKIEYFGSNFFGALSICWGDLTQRWRKKHNKNTTNSIFKVYTAKKKVQMKGKWFSLRELVIILAWARIFHRDKWKKIFLSRVSAPLTFHTRIKILWKILFLAFCISDSHPSRCGYVTRSFFFFLKLAVKQYLPL